VLSIILILTPFSTLPTSDNYFHIKSERYQLETAVIVLVHRIFY